MRPICLAALLACAVGCGGLSGKAGNGGGSGGANPVGAQLNLDPHVQHTLAALNGFRAQHGAGALVLDDNLTAFSQTAAQMLASGGSPHAYFNAQVKSGAIWQDGFCGNGGENQTGSGWKVGADEDATIDAVLQAMMDEGPGGGHYDNIVDGDFTRVGVGLVVGSDQSFSLSNDFSGGCG
jgi:hypothetical protein